MTRAEETSRTAPDPGDPPRALSGSARFLVLGSITTGTFMANVDATAVTVALPTMAREFDVRLDALQWVLTAYLLAITAILPVFGRLADLVGRKRILNCGLGLFVASSLVVAIAPTFPVLIASRAVQGVGAAMFMATIMAVAVTTFPAEQRGRVLGLIGSIVAAGTLLGPALGGLLTEAFGWRSIFLINVPIGLLGVIGTLFFLPADRGSGGSLRQLDPVGAALFAAFAACLLLGLGSGPTTGWTGAGALGLLLAAAASLLLFAGWELRVPSPLVDLRVFGSRVFGFGNLAGFLYYVLTVLPPLLFPLYLHDVLHWSTGATGLLMTLPAVAMLLVSAPAGWWSDRVGSMLPSLVALGVMTLVMAATAFLGAASSPWLIGLLLALLGAALGLFGGPNNAAVMGALGPGRVGTANGVVATLRNFGRAVGVAVVVLVYQSFAGTSATAGVPAETFLAGFRGVFLAGALVGAAAFGVVLVMHRPRGATPAARPSSTSRPV